MSFSVSINLSTKAQYFDQFFESNPEINPDLAQEILEDFKRYKFDGELPSYFGRDVLYLRPDSIRDSALSHIHLDLALSNPFQGETNAFYRRSDISLVYTQGFSNPQSYSILAILKPAHTLASNNHNQLIRKFARIADEFRNRH